MFRAVRPARSTPNREYNNTLKIMKKFIPHLLIAILTMGSVIYMDRLQPAAMESLLMKIDTFGITSVGAKEKLRVAQIKSLPITYEQKQVLIGRTIFMGANTTMVFLALGNPRSASATPEDAATQRPKIDKWVYYFSGDKRPTVLEFENSVLTSAYKGSVLDVQVPQQALNQVQ